MHIYVYRIRIFCRDLRDITKNKMKITYEYLELYKIYYDTKTPIGRIIFFFYKFNEIFASRALAVREIETIGFLSSRICIHLPAGSWILIINAVMYLHPYHRPFSELFIFLFFPTRLSRSFVSFFSAA